ncbi:hypothetical protein T265_05444 [Opisthorchis viverrini]|uniref:Uncharacterized protein n=1 Tax=Opisthorchis viverrini TaxID=6198 RepID=A0A074ZP23_OPIVI|nr:hypothetical protein T265_05444 [Opisthorchis viverrini]KER27557.1 hypothetical protein T265_05444 [Opisthorchis viverrini]
MHGGNAEDNGSTSDHTLYLDLFRQRALISPPLVFQRKLVYLFGSQDFFVRLKHKATWCSTFSCLETSQTRDSAGFQGSLLKNQISLQMSRLKHKAAWCSTFSCLETSQTRDSAGFQGSLSKNQISLQKEHSDEH